MDAIVKFRDTGNLIHFFGTNFTDNNPIKQNIFYQLIRVIYVSLNWVIIGTGNGLTPVFSRPLPEQMLV